ncbi:MAG: alpha/beta fold hydrolase [Rhodobacteraceae bacterium]|nr:alpha/beta fold hydrolase [Paracoccaceae bacterium]
MLNTIVVGEPGGKPPLLIVHGLFGSARNWGVLQKRLGKDRQVLAVDLRNHGDSFHDDDNSYGALADDLAEVIMAHGGIADVLGHSMGGKAAMVLALQQPELVQHLLVADIAPVGYGHSQMHNLEAMRSVDLTGVTRRAEVDAQLQANVSEAPLRAFFLQSLALGENGARWKLNLDALGNAMDEILGFPAINGNFSGPTLFVHGGASDYVTAAHHQRILELFPDAEFNEIAGAGHWLHAEKPREFQQAVTDFLTQS